MSLKNSARAMVQLHRHPNSIVGDRILLRRYRATDETPLFEAARESIPEVYPFLPWCHPEYDREDSKNWIESSIRQWQRDESYNFAIWSRTEEALVGGCGLHLLGTDKKRANLGYWIRTSRTGAGLACEAARLLSQYGFSHLGLTRVEIIVDTANGASRQVAIKCGATFEGILRNRLFVHGETHDALGFSLVPEDVFPLPPSGRSR